MENNFTDFIGGSTGTWKVVGMKTVKGLKLENVAYIDILQHSLQNKNAGLWTLTGFTSNIRYAEKKERERSLLQSNLIWVDLAPPVQL